MSRSVMLAITNLRIAEPRSVTLVTTVSVKTSEFQHCAILVGPCGTSDTSEAATEAMKLAEKLSHPHTLVYTMSHARGFLDLFRRRCEDTSSYAGLVISICKEHGFSHWINFGVILDGWAAVCAGHLDRGKAVLQEGIVRWQKAGARLWLPMYRVPVFPPRPRA